MTYFAGTGPKGFFTGTNTPADRTNAPFAGMKALIHGFAVARFSELAAPVAFFIVVREGETSDDADDLLVLDDDQLVRTLGSLIARRLGGWPLAAAAPALRPVRTSPPREDGRA